MTRWSWFTTDRGAASAASASSLSLRDAEATESARAPAPCMVPPLWVTPCSTVPDAWMARSLVISRRCEDLADQVLDPVGQRT